ncbi:MAG TPA: sigma-70 family RNA polymerase sigma factor [Vicinamibacterales bacterium]
MDRARAERLYQKADAGRWSVPVDVFIGALERSSDKAFAGRRPSEADLDRYFNALHVSDLALACACEMGDSRAWDHFVQEFRPAMYRSADAMASGGAAREIVDALYAELFGLKEKDGVRQSVFRYFHGRSSLATWLRSLIAQRYVDRHRQARRLDPLPDDISANPLRAPATAINPDRARFATAMRSVLASAIAALAARDRLRLACYYAREMTLAQIGKLTREHEATVSRQLARTRRHIRSDVEARLATGHNFAKAEIEECFASIVDDAGNLDVAEWLDSGRKSSAHDRSMREDPS